MDKEEQRAAFEDAVRSAQRILNRPYVNQVSATVGQAWATLALALKEN